MTNFKNLKELFDFFKDEETCRNYYEQQRWGGTPACPFCGSLKVYRTNRGFKCGEKECHKKFTVTVGTIFENSKIGLRTWFAAMYLITAHKKGISSLQLSRDLSITQKTAWFVLHRIREMLQDKKEEPLNDIVEVDETHIGGRMKNKHKSVRKKAHVENKSHTSNKAVVVGLLARNNKVRVTIYNSQEKTLKGIVKENVHKEAVIVTDSLNAYRGLDKDFAGHEVVNHTEDEYVRGHWHTNTVEGFFSQLKRSIYGIYHQVSPKHLERYCIETAYRYNTRKIKDNERFEFTVLNAQGRLKYKDLVKKGQDGENPNER